MLIIHCTSKIQLVLRDQRPQIRSPQSSLGVDSGGEEAEGAGDAGVTSGQPWQGWMRGLSWTALGWRHNLQDQPIHHAAHCGRQGQDHQESKQGHGAQRTVDHVFVLFAPTNVLLSVRMYSNQRGKLRSSDGVFWKRSVCRPWGNAGNFYWCFLQYEKNVPSTVLLNLTVWRFHFYVYVRKRTRVGHVTRQETRQNYSSSLVWNEFWVPGRSLQYRLRVGYVTLNDFLIFSIYDDVWSSCLLALFIYPSSYQGCITSYGLDS